MDKLKLQAEAALAMYSRDSVDLLQKELHSIMSELEKDDMKKIGNFSGRIDELNNRLAMCDSLVKQQTNLLNVRSNYYFLFAITLTPS